VDMLPKSEILKAFEHDPEPTVSEAKGLNINRRSAKPITPIKWPKGIPPEVKDKEQKWRNCKTETKRLSVSATFRKHMTLNQRSAKLKGRILITPVWADELSVTWGKRNGMVMAQLQTI